MIFFRLALKSLRNRAFSSIITVFSIALSVALLLSVERTKRAAEEGFTQSISQVDLLVGGRTGPLNLILYTVFNMGNASNNISWDSYQKFKIHQATDWTIPYSLGDGHHGFRVVATDENFYDHYHFRGKQKVEFEKGTPALDIWDVVIGSEVAQKLKYKQGDQVVIAHGVTHTEGVQTHDDKPFHVTGILKPTGTALDQSLYISLYGMEAIHMDWQNGAAPTEKNRIPQAAVKKENIKIGPITAFFLRTKSRIATLSLQREINTFTEEPLLAIIPGATLSELWRSLSQIDRVLKIISWMVLTVGMAAMLSSILAGLNERRREMAILRSLGAGPGRIMLLLVSESSALAFTGIIIGLILELSFFFILRGYLESQFCLYISGNAVTSSEVIYLVAVFIFGSLVGFIPAIRAMNTVLKDGLSVRV